MSLIQATGTWLRLTFRWSNSIQTWHERLGDIVLAAGLLLAGVFAWLSWHDTIGLPGWLVVLLVLVLLAPALALNWAGWLKVFGPVLYYDMIRQARRSRFIILRMLYAFLLVGLLACIFVSDSHYRRMDANRAAEIADTFFNVFMVVQFLTVVLLTPAYVAGAIAEEKERRTLEFMLATDLLNREIVLSKLGSRLANLVLIVLTGLPILSCLQFLGGVDPNMVLAGFVVTAMTILGQAGVSIYCSTVCKRPREAIAMAYLGVVVYYVVAGILNLAITPQLGSIGALPIWFGDDPPTVMNLVEIFNAGNLVAVIIKVQMAGARGNLAIDLPAIVRDYSLFHGLLALFTVGMAVARIRRIALVQTYGTASRTRRGFRLWARPRIGTFPMLWKELYCEGSSRAGWISMILFTILLTATFAPAVIRIFFAMDRFYDEVQYYNALASWMNGWCRTCNVIVGCLTLMAVAVRASTSVTSERDKQTLDTLLTTPLDSSSILFSKWLGSIAGARFGMIWLAAIWAVAFVTGGIHFIALPLMATAWLIYAAFAASLGLLYSTICKTSLRATVLTILTGIVVSVGHWLPWFCCALTGALRGQGAEHLAKMQLGILTPPFVLGFLPISPDELRLTVGSRRDSDWTEFMAFSLVGLVAWMFFTGLVYAIASSRFRTLTHRQRTMEPDRWTLDAATREALRRRRQAQGPVLPWTPPTGAVVFEEAEMDAEEPLRHDESD
jgi:ABC-type transport system involved in multi-copper enzyme maturation permease subunit